MREWRTACAWILAMGAGMSIFCRFNRNLRGTIVRNFSRHVPVKTFRQRDIVTARATKSKIAVIGSGISGCVCAGILGKKDCDIHVFESAETIGGRTATIDENIKVDTEEGLKEDDTFMFDIGTQYISPKSENFIKITEEWAQNGWIKPWEGRVVSLKLSKNEESLRCETAEKVAKSPRWIGQDGFKSLINGLLESENTKVSKKTLVNRATFDEEVKSWKLYGIVEKEVISENTTTIEKSEEILGEFDAIIGTSRENFSPGGLFEVSGTDLEKISKFAPIENKQSFSLCIAFRNPLPDLGFEGALIEGGRSIAWISKENSKFSTDKTLNCWVLQSNEEINSFASAEQQVNVLNLENNDLKDYLLYGITYRMVVEFLEIVESITGKSVTEEPFTIQIKRWVDGIPMTSLAGNIDDSRRCLVDKEKMLVSCGDFHSGARVEDAVLSGEEAAHNVIEILDL
mmetsp:Transcript_21881/g.32608  ORF Transcript_21881/g.32608 Transcript_21881/m.32608 type:complete len:458 (+) Transcript_21881:9-1382(+)